VFETTLTRAMADERARDGVWSGRVLGEVLRATAAADPDQLAIVDARRRLTYAELDELVESAALGLIDIGVRSGDVVTVQLPNWAEFVVAEFAIERIGAVINPVAPIFRQHELRSMFRLARPVAVVVAAEFRGFAYPAMMADVRSTCPTLRTVIVVDGTAGDVDLSWDELLRRGRSSAFDAAALDLLTPGADDVHEIIFTSGTTGEPNGVMHTHNTLWAGSQAMIDAQGLAPGDVFHMASTFAHQTGLLLGVRLFVQVGATGVFQDVWEPETFLDLIERERIVFSAGAAPFLADVLRVADLDRRDLTSWRLFGCFGAPIPRPLLEAARQRLPCRVMPGWGMTEVGLVTSTTPSDDDDKTMATDGRPLVGMSVRVVDDDGRDVAPGGEGDLLCRSCGEFVGYVQGRAFTRDCYADDGWFMTGDRARVDDAGYIRITGRTKDLVIRGGENVPVKEVEDVLMRHPAVRSVAVVAAPDERLGEIGCAFVVLEGEETFTLHDMREHLERAGVTRQFWPERVELLDELPMTPSGKVQKFKLRERVTPAAAGA